MNRIKLAVGITAAAALALPAGAGAHAKPSTQSVGAHVRSADQALTMVADLVADHDAAAAAIEMVRNRRQTQAAAREAARLRGSRASATGLRLVARQRNANAEAYAELVDELTGDTQTAMARAIGDNLNARETALAKLTTLLPSLPAAAQPGMAKAIASLSGNGSDEVDDIEAAMQSGRIPEVAKPYLEKALATATGAISTGLARLQGLVSGLPTAAQGPVQSAIDRIGGILNGIFGGGTTTAAAPGETTSGLPIPSALPIPSGLPIPSIPTPGR